MHTLFSLVMSDLNSPLITCLGQQTIYNNLIHFTPSVPPKGKVGPIKCSCGNCSLSGMDSRKMVDFYFYFM